MSLTELSPDRATGAVPPGAPGAAGTGRDGDASGARTSARAAAWVAVLVVVLAVVVAPGGDQGFAPGQFGRVAAGAVEVHDAGGWRTVAVGGVVGDGDVLRSPDPGAELAVRGGSLALSRFAELAVDGDEVRLARGELLFEADRTYAVHVDAAEGRGRGTWRVAASGLARYAVYAGGLAVTGPAAGDPVEVGLLREVPLEAGGADRVQPLRYLPSDPWDQRLLAEAIHIDEVLAATQRGLGGRYGTALQPASFYRDFLRSRAFLAYLDRLAVEADDARYGPPAPTLVALIVADLLVGRAGLSPQDAADGIDALRRAGAPWGLIVVEHGLAAADLDAELDRAARQRGEAVEAGRATAPLAPADPGAPGVPSTPPPADGDPRPGEPSPSPRPSDPDDPGEEPPDPDGPDEGDEPGALDPVQEEVDDVGSLLEEVVPGGSDVTDEVNDAVETVDELLPPTEPPAEPPAAPPTGPESVTDAGEDVVDDGAGAALP
jgi:hypothetical protein